MKKMFFQEAAAPRIAACAELTCCDYCMRYRKVSRRLIHLLSIALREVTEMSTEIKINGNMTLVLSETYDPADLLMAFLDRRE